MLNNFLIPGKASFICGGQFGSEAKGAAAAWVAHQLWSAGPIDAKLRRFDIVTTNAGAQAGHTSIHNGVKKVVFHLPTAPLITPGSIGYLNAGAIIDLDGLTKEIDEHWRSFSEFYIHPNAAIITDDCRTVEGRADSAQTAIASTRKGVGEALARKVLRSGISARSAMPGTLLGDDGSGTMRTVMVHRLDLNNMLARHNKSMLVEVPQGFGLGLNQRFYPHCTSRECTPAQAASDAGIHHSLCGPVMLVLRTYPIRVGNIMQDSGIIQGRSGSCYPDQREISWDELGVPPEITTVTKRVRRVFTWSHQQAYEAISATRPTHILLSHVDYLKNQQEKLDSYVLSILTVCKAAGVAVPQIFFSTGPTTADVHEVDAP